MFLQDIPLYPSVCKMQTPVVQETHEDFRYSIHIHFFLLRIYSSISSTSVSVGD